MSQVHAMHAIQYAAWPCVNARVCMRICVCVYVYIREREGVPLCLSAKRVREAASYMIHSLYKNNRLL